MPKLENFAEEDRNELTDLEIAAYKEIINHILVKKPNKKGIEIIKREVETKYKLKKFQKNTD